MSAMSLIPTTETRDAWRIALSLNYRLSQTYELIPNW
jgi:hypothetical protein